MPRVVPELGPGGWVTDPDRQLRIMFADSIEADASQSTPFGETITSLPSIIHRFQHDPDELARQVGDRYKKYFSDVFDSAECLCTPVSKPGEQKYHLDLSISVIREGTQYDLRAAVEIEEGVLKDVITEVDK